MAAASGSLPKALLAFQAEGVALQKNAINPHFKNKYISLDSLMEQVLPMLNRLGIVLLQFPASIDGAPALTTTLVLAATGESISETMPLCLGKNDPQGQGSAITYARRYALMSILGLVADVDTDGSGVKAQVQQEPVVPMETANAEAVERSAFTSSGDSPF